MTNNMVRLRYHKSTLVSLMPPPPPMLLLLLLLHQAAVAHGWYVSTPVHAKDWSDMARVIVQAFDAPSDEKASRVEQLRWVLYERQLAEQATYRQYVQTARKMKLSKYNILVAKEGDQVIGVAEVGINKRTVPVEDDNDSDGETENLRRPTIGLLCVAEKYRQQGVGAALVARCQNIVANIWKDDVIFAEVDEENKQAIAFFQSLGFIVCNNHETVMVKLRHRLKVERRPHLLLSCSLMRETEEVEVVKE